ncbi:MAG TPA: polyphenol oxidase family protein [Solirubrobacteraceae bacterium]|nr:polyphenol oxidase family protein [Solirubrobacteraceae bacterium]
MSTEPAPPAAFRREGEHFAVELPGATALFTTRRGGHSSGPYESLNLGRLTDDHRETVQSNLRRVQSACGARLLWGRQVHGTEVIVHDRNARLAPAEDPEPSPDPGDGRLAVEPGLAPMVLTADCLAVIVAGHGGVAALHAGWRGLAGGVIQTGVRKLREAGVGGELQAAIGPHARVCCYEVGDEVHGAFAAAGHGDARGGRNRRNLDMTLIAVRQLRQAGVREVHDLGLCTICSDPGLFFSHRRDHGVTGRQAGLGWLS